MTVRMRTALDHAKSPDPVNALMASTVRSSTMAFTWAVSELTSVSVSVRMTSLRYGKTNGQIFRHKVIMFIQTARGLSLADKSKKKGVEKIKDIFFCIHLPPVS